MIIAYLGLQLNPLISRCLRKLTGAQTQEAVSLTAFMVKGMGMRRPARRRIFEEINDAQTGGHEPPGAQQQYSAEEKIRIVLDGLKGEDSIAELCRREGIAQSLYYSWSKEFLEAGKKRLAGDTARAATSNEVKDLRRESRDLKEVVAEQALELRLLKKSMIADGGDDE